MFAVADMAAGNYKEKYKTNIYLINKIN